MNSRRPDDSARQMSHATISRRHLLAMTGVVAAGGLSGCASRVASQVTNTGASPAAAFAGRDDSVGEPHVSRLTPTLSASAGPLSGDVELEAWVTAVTLEDYNTPRSDGRNSKEIDEYFDTAAAIELENTLLSQTKATADAISKRSANTGRSQLSEMGNTIDEVQATVESCSDDVCVTVRENADVRENLVQQAQMDVENGEWDDAAAKLDKVQDKTSDTIQSLSKTDRENGGNTSPIYEGDARGGDNILNHGRLAPPGGDPISDADREALVEYLSGSPMVGERFAVCLPDAEVPGGDGSLAEEVTPQRFIDYVTGRAADDGEVYAWGSNIETANDDYDDNNECAESGGSGSDEILCKSNHLAANLTGPLDTGGGLVSLSDDNGRSATVTIVNTPPTVSEDETGPSLLACPPPSKNYRPDELSRSSYRPDDILKAWGPESWSSSQTPTVICQVMVQPPECPVPVRALLYVKRCRSDDQLVYTGGWVLDTAGLYEESMTALTEAGETQVVGIDASEFGEDVDGDRVAELVSQGVSGERARRGARMETGSIASLVKAGVVSEVDVSDIRSFSPNYSRNGPSTDGEDDSDAGDVVVTHCPFDTPVLHLVNTGDASKVVKFKSGSELSDSVN